VLLVLLLGICGLLVSFWRSKNRVVAAGSNRSFWDYLLLWPVIFDQPARRERVARGERFLTTCELLGWAAVLLLIVLAVAFDW
jgi:hypothetical protein